MAGSTEFMKTGTLWAGVHGLCRWIIAEGGEED
jgi:hypothetical protein